MAKSRGRKFAELVAPANGVFAAASIPTIAISKLANSTFSVNSESASLGGNVVIDSNDVTEHTNALYFTNARADARITAAALLPLAGGTMTGNLTLGDNVNAYFGASTDLRIYHDGTNSHIINSTGELRITGSNIAIKSDSNKLYLGAGDDLKIYHTGTHSYIENGTGTLFVDAAQVNILDGANTAASFTAAGAVTLYNAGSQKLATTSTGVQTTGTVNVNGAYTLPTSDGSANQVLQTDGSGTLSFANAGSGSSVFSTSGSNAYYNSGHVGIGTSTPNQWASYTDSSATVLQVKDSSDRARIVAQGGNGAHLDLVDSGGASNDKHLNLGVDGGVGKFGSLNDDGTAWVQQYILSMDIGNGNVGIGTNSPAASLHVAGSPQATTGALTFLRNGDATSSNTSFGGIHFSSSPGTDFSIGKANVNAATSLSFRNGNTGASLMELTSAGDLGIGTISPAFKLHAYHPTTNVVARFESGDSEVWIDLHDSDSGNYGALLGHDSTNLFKVANASAANRLALGNTGILLTTGGFEIADSNTRMSEGDGNSVRITTDSGYVDIGPMNTTWCHFQTDRGKFYFDKTVHFDGQIYDYAGGGTSNPYWHAGANFTSANILTIGQVKLGDGNDGVFYSDTNGRTAFANGDFYIQNTVTNYYNYATNQYIGDSSGDNIYFRANVLSGTGWSINGAGKFTTRDVQISAGYHLHRTDHHSGHLEGSYNNVAANGSKSNPIYTIGYDYNPADASLSNMYGIGYSNGSQSSFITGAGSPSGWGLYVAADGDSRIFLNGSEGKIHSANFCQSSAFYGHANVAGTGNATYHPSGIYSTGSNWLYGTIYTNGHGINFTGGSIASCNDIVCDQNYGRGLVGVYSATRYQHVWSMGASYRTNAAGTSYGNMYGLTYTHTNIGTGTNQAISGLSHQLQHRSNGTLTAAIGAGIWTSGNVTAYSDIAVKTNLVKIPNAIEKVCAINGYTYERTDYVKDPEDKNAPDILRQAGVVAQEVEKVLPEVVSGDEGNKAVAYGNIVSLLIEAIKEQQGQIEDLKHEIQALKEAK